MLPVGERLSAPEFSFGEAIGTVFKNVVAKVFKATYPERPVPKATEEIVAALAERESVTEDERLALAHITRWT